MGINMYHGKAYSPATPFASHACQALGRPARFSAIMTLGIGWKVAFPPVMVLYYFGLFEEEEEIN